MFKKNCYHVKQGTTVSADMNAHIGSLTDILWNKFLKQKTIFQKYSVIFPQIF